MKATTENVEEVAGRMLESHEPVERAGAIIALSVASLMTSVRSSVEEMFGKPGGPPPPFVQELMARMAGGPHPSPPPINPWTSDLSLLGYGVIWPLPQGIGGTAPKGPPQFHLVAAFVQEDDAISYARARAEQGLKVVDLGDPEAEPYDPPETN